jgi:hypothetical protein
MVGMGFSFQRFDDELQITVGPILERRVHVV